MQISRGITTIISCQFSTCGKKVERLTSEIGIILFEHFSRTYFWMKETRSLLTLSSARKYVNLVDGHLEKTLLTNERLLILLAKIGFDTSKERT